MVKVSITIMVKSVTNLVLAQRVPALVVGEIYLEMDGLPMRCTMIGQ
jgi:hypothetical protein